jgi:transposase-like protein
MVTATLEPVASVSIVARRNDVNANQLVKWRRQYGGLAPSPPPEPVRLMRVEISAPLAGMFEIELRQGCRVRISGAVDLVVVTALRLMARR